MANDIFPGATLIQLVEWGFPMGSPRPTPSPALAYSVIHITANLAPAQNELAWRFNDTALQNSATFFVNRDGSIWQALGDPLHMDPWTNGDAQAPDMSNPRIAAVINAGVNPNERSLITIENVGRESSGYPITPEQEAANAQLIKYYHGKADLEISRETVVGHYQINSVNRANCPAVDKSVIDRIVSLAQGGGDMRIKGALVEWYNNRQTTITVRAGFTEDPTAMPYNNLHIFEVGTPFAVIAKVRGNFLGTTDEWYFGPAATIPPQMGYVVTDHCGPLVQVEATGGYTQDELDTAVADGVAGALATALPSAQAAAATAVAEAAVAKAEEF